MAQTTPDYDLSFQLIEELGRPMRVYQLQDGSIWYYDGQDLYVKWKGEKFESDFKKRFGKYEVHGMGVCDDGLYFVSQRKIRKATFDCPLVEFKLVRHLLEDEKVLDGAICTRESDGKEFAYRMSQNSVNEGIEMGGDAEDYVQAIFGKRIFYRSDSKLKYWMWKSSNEEYYVEFHGPIEGRTLIYARHDASPYVYAINGQVRMAIIRNGTIVPLKISPFQGIWTIRSIVGVHEGVVTVMAYDYALWQSKLKDVEQPRSNVERMLEELLRETTDLRESMDRIDLRYDICQSIYEMEDQLKQINATLCKVSINPNVTSERQPSKEMKNVDKTFSGQSTSYNSDLTSDNSEKTKDPVCNICRDKCPNIIFYDCMHVVICADCYRIASSNPTTALRTCPKCRNPIKKSEKVFF